MKTAIFLIAAVLVTVSGTHASEDGIRIVCDKTADAVLGQYTLYKTPPKTLQEHVMNSMMGGLTNLLIEKPTQVYYVIKERENRIENADGTSNFGGAKIEINSNHIQAISPNAVMKMNRLSGEMTHTFILSDETVDAWKKKHGGTPPRSGTWHYQCRKAPTAF